MFTSKYEDAEKQGDEYFDYSPRGQWLRAAVLGANDGLVFVACLMMGIGDMKDVKVKFLLGLANVVAGAISMAVREYVSVCSQLDLELAQMKRDKSIGRNNKEEQKLSNPLVVAIAASISFSLGAITPLLVGTFILDEYVKLGVLVAGVSMGLVGFGWIWSVIGGTSLLRSCFRVLSGGLLAFAITYGQTTLIGSAAVYLNPNDLFISMNTIQAQFIHSFSIYKP
ncbi:hypothetical protein QVD17_18948 [Tagetes erecta]|uniref:Vacuolar iron transporter n=1 Tax=Tagetes erecta TaxID=13708 RepID=A0AAD8KNS6_TARER|nr:hypothetical protein QVD17_18948 [Tagetes erecta]